MTYSVPPDKLGHYAVGTLIGACSYPFIGIYSLALVAGIAAAKELYDYRHKDKHTPEVLDFAWTVLGALTVAASHI